MNAESAVSERLRHAQTLGAAGRLEEAERALRAVLAEQPDNDEALHLLGITRWHAGDTAGARVALQRAAALVPGRAEVHYALAGVIEAVDGPAGAISGYERTVALAAEFAPAWAALGIARAEVGELEGAVEALSRARILCPDDPSVLYALGQALCALGHNDAAADTLRAALARSPGEAAVREALVGALRKADRCDEARVCLERALESAPHDAELHLALGNTLVDLGRATEATESYRRTLEIDPESLPAHEGLNRLIWQSDAHDGYLHSYVRAVAARPRSTRLRIAHAGWLTRAERFAEAEHELRDALRLDDAHAKAHGLLARALVNQGHTDEGLVHFRRAVACAPRDPRCRLDLARMLLVLGAHEEALGQVEAALASAPLDQEAVAYLAVCWRLLGDERAELINGYERFVRSYRIPVPDGYRDLRAFNQDLNQALDALHWARRHPQDQTLRGGTQTHGDLFERRIETVQQLRTSIAPCVQDYIDAMEHDSQHPLLRRRCERFRFATSWSCRLAGSGYHTNHVHPKGWISSCYYVSLPDAVKDASGKQGWLKFGETNMGLGERELIARLVQPEEGLLVLFPSYLFHGTIAFRSDRARTTVAFDVVPA